MSEESQPVLESDASEVTRQTDGDAGGGDTTMIAKLRLEIKLSPNYFGQPAAFQEQVRTELAERVYAPAEEVDDVLAGWGLMNVSFGGGATPREAIMDLMKQYLPGYNDTATGSRPKAMLAPLSAGSDVENLKYVRINGEIECIRCHQLYRDVDAQPWVETVVVDGVTIEATVWLELQWRLAASAPA